jgi:MFS family permease
VAVVTDTGGRGNGGLLASRTGRALVASQWLHLTAQGGAAVALPIVILAAGGGVLAAGSAVLATYAPYLVLGVPAGLAADRTDRRTAIALGTAVSSAAALLLALLCGGPSPALAAVLAGGIGMGIGRTVADAGMTAAMGDMTAGRSFTPAAGLLMSGEIGGRVAGGVLVWAAVALGGPGMALALVAVLAAAALAAALSSSPLPPPGGARRDIGASIGRAAGFLCSPDILPVLLAGAAWNAVIAGALAQAVPRLVDGGIPLSLTAAVVGTANIGGLAVVTAAPRVIDIFGPRRLLPAAIAVSALLCAAFGAAAGAMAAAVYIAFITANSAAALMVSALRQASAPPAERGIVATMSRAVTWAGFLAGGAVASAVIPSVGFAAAFAAAGAAGILVAGVSMLSLSRRVTAA